jgi:AraC-like DNA-binding protein
MDVLPCREVSLTRAELRARRIQSLRRVPVLMSALCQVRHGCKTVVWQGRTMRADRHHLVLLPAGCELGITNEPGSQGYRAELVGVPAEVLRDFCGRHADLLQGGADGLCVPMNVHVGQAWDALRAGLAAAAPPALQFHLLDTVLLALALAGQLAPLVPAAEGGLGARVEALLLFNPSAEWSAAAVARELHLGVSSLRRRLAAEGRSLREILDEVRMNAALSALQTTARPIGEIAAQSGYASASRFAARFRRRFGLSPRALRQTL